MKYFKQNNYMAFLVKMKKKISCFCLSYTRRNRSQVPVSPPGDHRQSFCRRVTDRKRDSFGSTVTSFKGYVSRCFPIEDEYGYLDPLKWSR